MAHIETLEDVLNDIADKAMVYGACKCESDDGCENKNPFCCRVGFFAHYEDRILQAVENRKRLDDAGL